MFVLLLALAIFAALISLNCLIVITRVAFGAAYWNSRGAMYVQTGLAAVCGALAAWLFRLALGL